MSVCSQPTFSCSSRKKIHKFKPGCNEYSPSPSPAQSLIFQNTPITTSPFPLSEMDLHDLEKASRLRVYLHITASKFDSLAAKYDRRVVIPPGDSGVYNVFAACGFFHVVLQHYPSIPSLPFFSSSSFP